MENRKANWKGEPFMRTQEAAKLILEEEQRPLSSREIAKRALERKMVISNSKDPVFSHATTIDKNIRDGVYNRPQLVFIHSPKGRLIGLPSWETEIPAGRERKPEEKEIVLRVPHDLYGKIELAAHAQLADSFNDTLLVIIRAGLTAVSETIKVRIMNQLQTLGSSS
jgi:hypothetical protein